MSSNSVLFMNIGTGNVEQSIDEVYIPAVSKAIDSAEVDTIVLFISTNNTSSQIAKKIKEKYEAVGCVVEIKLLPDKGMEFNVDQCFVKYYDWMFPYRDKKITIDFTHGTKAMCAALYVCGMFYGVEEFQYTKKKQGETGFVDGEEIVQKNTALEARWRALFKQCQTLFQKHQYTAVEEILSGTPPKVLKGQKEKFLRLAKFCSAYDSFDYKTSYDENIRIEFDISELNFKYNPDFLEFLKKLQNPICWFVDRDTYKLAENEKKNNLSVGIQLVFDLYANGLRRLEDGLVEDAMIRAYRMLELMGQIYLFKFGYLPDKLSKNDKNVVYFAQDKRLSFNEGGFLCPLGREKTLDFLETLEANEECLNDLRQEGEVLRSVRNKSILIHGFSIGDCKIIENSLNTILEIIKYFISKDEFEHKKQIALFLNNNFKVENNE